MRLLSLNTLLGIDFILLGVAFATGTSWGTMGLLFPLAVPAAAGLGDGPVEVAELQAAFTHEELLLRRVLGLGDGVKVNASGGALRENPIMATGLCRIGHAADHVFAGGRRALAHATSGPCLQQNLVCILEGRS